jgi:hypothetical protein
VGGATYYLWRLSQGPEVVWDRHGDWRPWDKIKYDQNVSELLPETAQSKLLTALSSSLIGSNGFHPTPLHLYRLPALPIAAFRSPFPVIVQQQKFLAINKEFWEKRKQVAAEKRMVDQV